MEKAEEHHHGGEEEIIKYSILRLVLGMIVAFIGIYFENKLNSNILASLFVILGYCILIFRTAKSAILTLIKEHSIDETFLMSISCIGAYLIGEHLEGLMVIILYEIGEILEDKAVDKSRDSIEELMDIRPEYANLKKGSKVEKVLPEEVKIGEVVIIKDGERVPLDGKIIKGEASLNMSSLTGESKLRKVSIGDEVLSGSINSNGLIEIEVIKEYKDSTVSKILDLVENATDRKAKTETFVSKLARVYTPIVIALAILVAIFLPIINHTITYSQSIYRALIFLVISCPCSIVISTPLAYFSGIGKASKEGILIKGSNFLDILKDVKEIGFDKTGTLTKGKFGISKIEVLSDKFSEEEILEIVILGESFSNHPIAKSILESNKKEVNTSKVKDYKEITGKGISYYVDDKKCLVGNADLVGYTQTEESTTVIHVKVNDELVSKIHLEDSLKEESKGAISKLNNIGIITKMFTGDKHNVATKIAEEIEIKEFKAEMLPEDKYKEIEKTIEKYRGTPSKVAFVGDGINDSPVLALSDIGISMGGIGQAAAIEASDIVIMTDDLNKIHKAIEISKKTRRIILENLSFAIGVKILTLLLSTFGIAGMWQAIFADVGVTLITIFNTLRILK